MNLEEPAVEWRPEWLSLADGRGAGDGVALRGRRLRKRFRECTATPRENWRIMWDCSVGSGIGLEVEEDLPLKFTIGIVADGGEKERERRDLWPREA